MIIGLGKLNTKTIVDDMILIAKGLNELHEKNPHHGLFRHSDGWGLAYLNDNNKWVTYKSVKPIYKDKNLHNFRHLQTEGLVVHVRRATKGRISFENTQPFFLEDNNGQYVFTHNGTIYEDIDLNKDIPLKGDSDSVKLFSKIYQDFIYGDLKNNPFFPLENFSSANFFLATPEKFLVGSNFNKYPEYYTMKLFKDSQKTIISSEVLPTYRDRKWMPLKSGTIVEIKRK